MAQTFVGATLDCVLALGVPQLCFLSRCSTLLWFCWDDDALGEDGYVEGLWWVTSPWLVSSEASGPCMMFFLIAQVPQPWLLLVQGVLHLHVSGFVVGKLHAGLQEHHLVLRGEGCCVIPSQRADLSQREPCSLLPFSPPLASGEDGFLLQQFAELVLGRSAFEI